MAEEKDAYTFIPLRPIDRMYGFSHDSKLQPNISTTASYENQNFQILTPTIIYAALQQVINQHPRLAVAQIRSTTKHGHHTRLAVRLNTIDLRNCVKFVDDPKIQVKDILEAEENRWFSIEPLGPQWRLVVVNGRDIVFLFNHLACDGMSTLAFHRSLLTSINNVSVPGLIPEDSKPSDFALASVPDVQPAESPLAAFERDTPRIFMLTAVAKEVLRTAAVKLVFFGRYHLFHDAKHSKYRLRTGEEVTRAPAKDSCEPRYASIEVPPETMKRLMVLCKKHGATFTSLLHTVILGVLSSYLYKNAVYARSRLAVSYRRYTGTPDSTMTDEAGNIYWGRRLKSLRQVFAGDNMAHIQSVIWQEAKQYKEHVQDDLSDVVKHSKTNGYSKFMGVYDEQLARTIGILGSQRHRTVEISNLGVFNPIELDDEKQAQESSRPWKITGISFNGAPSHRCFGCAVTFGIVSMKGGSCQISMGYDQNAIDSQSMELFSGALSRKLVDLSLEEGEEIHIEPKVQSY